METGFVKPMRKTKRTALFVSFSITGLHSHDYQSLTGADGDRVCKAYAQNETHGAFRVFFHYGPALSRIPVPNRGKWRAGLESLCAKRNARRFSCLFPLRARAEARVGERDRS